MPESQTNRSFELEEIIERARALRREAAARAPRVGVELFAKIAERVRLERGHAAGPSAFRRIVETGIAVRTLTSPAEGAGFAAAAGFSRDTVRWVLDRAMMRDSLVSPESPDTQGVAKVDSLDLGPDEPIPSRGDLAAILGMTRSIEWLEVGRATEVLVGPEGWSAVRRRQRVWGLVRTSAARLIARRTLEMWNRAVPAGEVEPTRSEVPGDATGQTVTFLPDAASPIVAALVGWFHLDEAPIRVLAGRGWTVEDDPFHPDGLSGGSYDDAGFVSERRSLALDGMMVGVIGGAGTLRRSSFRHPPRPTTSNLTMPPGAGDGSSFTGSVVDRCRVVRLQPAQWVLEMEVVPSFAGSRRRSYARLSPERLLRGCTARIGQPEVTAEGPIVPALRFEGIPLVFAS